MGLIDMAGRLLRVNDALCRITGYTAEQVYARLFSELSDPHDLDIDALQIAELLDGHIPTYQIEKRFRHAWGHLIWVLLNVSLVRDDEGRPLHRIAQIQDISERKELEGRLEHLVDHDFLTALFNGRRFEQALAQEIKSSARYDGGGAVLLLDLDHFKAVNDQFGHKAGDDLLKTVAAALRSRIRETDFLARLGGDEFGIILPQVDAPQAEVVADGIVKALRRQTAMLAEQQLPITASVGVALFGGLTNVEILAAADLAMYEAKAAGRDRFAVYRPVASDHPRRSRLAEAERIQRALAHDALELHCQPILDLATNEVSQYELLVRLRTEQGDLLAPSAFLYVAERFGSIVSIDAWVVRQAVALVAARARVGTH
jgi:diguanylate cyclase (GGDEF)-like protein/PAS domain S-box-containing protein